MHIAFDVDGVLLFEDEELWIAYFEKEIGTRFDRESFAKNHNWNLATGMSTEALTNLYVKRLLAADTKDPDPTTGAAESLDVLRRFASCHVVTARDARVKNLTIKLLGKHFATFDSYHFGHVESKVEPLKNIGTTVFIEDSAYQTQLAAENGITAILFPQPRSWEYLQNHRHPKVIYPSTADWVREQMDLPEIRELHRQTWKEVVEICQKKWFDAP